MLKLRADLVPDYEGPLPEWCRLPEGYRLVVETDLTHCERCGQLLRRQHLRRRSPIGLTLGQPDLVHAEKQCPSCKEVYPCEEIADIVPPKGKYAYDLVVAVGRAVFQDHCQMHEVRDRLRSACGIEAPNSTLRWLALRFLDGLRVVHHSYAAKLAQRLSEQRGGYILLLDGTCEAGTSVVFIAVDGESSLTLHSAKIPSESIEDIKAFVEECVGLFGPPLATLRDLSQNIKAARDAVLEDVPDFVCHYHLLANIGELLCKSHRNALSKRLRQFGLRRYLTSQRRDLIGRSKRGEPIPQQLYEAFLQDSREGIDASATQLRRLLVFTLIRWIEDCVVELDGEYFPFDQAELVFYKRSRELLDFLEKFLKSNSLDHTSRKVFENLRDALAPTRDDRELVKAAKRLEKAFEAFEELREVLRLEEPDGDSLLRQHSPRPETVEEAREAEQRLKDYRDGLNGIIENESDRERAKDAKIIAGQLDKYWGQLFGRVILPDGKETPILVQRTNFSIEHKFGFRKRGWRRQSGNAKLKKRLDSCECSEFFVDNLSNETYVEVVYDGTLDNMAKRFAEHWPEIVRMSHGGHEGGRREGPSSSAGRRLRVSNSILRSSNFFKMMTSAMQYLAR